MMKTKTLIGVIVCVAGMALITNKVVSQDHKHDHSDPNHKHSDPQQPDGGDMAAAWDKANATGAFHAHLKQMVGTWHVTSKFWMMPGMPPAESEARSVSTLIMGGRYLRDEFHGSVMGQPFQGLAFTGYDNAKKKFVSTWIDSMGTGIMATEGTCDPSGKVFTFHGEHIDAMSGLTKRSRSVLKVINNNKYTFEMFETSPGQKEFRNMELIYTRQ